ncbi:MAG: hypothetical protein ACI4PO_05715 [Faecousia sp.]
MTDGISQEPHSFSQTFQRKIAGLTRRADHPLRYRMARAAVAVFLVLLTVFGVLFTLSPQVRAAVIGWVRSTVGNWFEYATDETAPPDGKYGYFLPDTFYGYTLLTTIDSDTGTEYIYTNEQGRLLGFGFLCGTDAGELFLDVEDCVYEPGSVGPFPADIYISPNEERNSAVVWQDTDNCILCYLMFSADKEELIALANEIETYKKIIE